MGQRSRKRGRRERVSDVPPAPARMSRSERRDSALRATLTPLPPGERPWVITVGALLAALNGLVQLVLFVAGVKPDVAGTRPNAFSVILFAVLMFVCAGGMWQMRYWAVLGFQALLAIVVLIFALLLIRASTVLGFVISIAVVGGGGFLFFRLVRVLSRIQMPKYPGS